MQVEIVSALIGAAVALPAAGAAYAVGRHQASATVSAALTQVEASQKQWRDNTRRSAWLAFIRVADELNLSTERMFRGDLTYDPAFQEQVANLFTKLADVEFEGPAKIYTLAREIQKNIARRIAFAAIVGPLASAHRKLNLKVAEARRDIALAGPANAPREAIRILETNDTLQALAAEREHIAATPPPEGLVDTNMAMLGPLMQGGEPNLRAGLAMMAHGMAQVTASAFAAAPTIVAEAHRRLGECGFNEGEIGALLFDSASGIRSIFGRDYGELSRTFDGVRDCFLTEADKHLTEPLPVPH
jgi:hypothetical protein